jgi:pyruvate formate lyase activating enzyme
VRDPEGRVFNIQRYSLHDGPGIRTTVFLKGCSLACKWCSNPEGIRPYPELMAIDRNCVACFKCMEVCTLKAIHKKNNQRVIDWEKCNLCFECVNACSYGALKKVGQLYSLDHLIGEIERDRLFYLNSGGGVTFSGGEPLLQHEFTREVFKICRQKMISTALDTCGHVPWEIIEKTLKFTDLVLYDIKQLDSILHQQATGQNNQLILGNFKRIVKMARTWVRVPLIPGFNDSTTFIQSLCRLISELGKTRIEKVSFLPYHSWGEQKYQMLDRGYEFTGTATHDRDRLEEIRQVVESFGIPASVGN